MNVNEPNQFRKSVNSFMCKPQKILVILEGFLHDPNLAYIEN